MELSKYKFKVFIKANLHDILNEQEREALAIDFEEFNFNNVKSYCTVISHEPIYKTLSNRFRIPDEYNWNVRYRKEATALDEIMKIEEIKSIDYWEYVGENIHCAINYERSQEESDFDVADGGQIKLVAEKYKEFLFAKRNININSELIIELNKLIQLASIAQKHNKELWFYDGYFWQ